jgi:hypothetical protein
MLPKRLFLGALLLTSLVIITGCAITSKSKENSSIQYRNAQNVCISFGYTRYSNAYHQCIDRVLQSSKNDLSPEQE